jgi:hypothetical protein
MLTRAVSVLVVEGLNVKLIVQLVPTARLLGGAGQLLVWAKSALLVPLMAILLKVSAEVPVLAIATRWAGLTVPTVSAVNDTLVWDSVTAGPECGGTFNDDGKSSDQTSPALVGPGINRTNRSADTS